MVWKSKIQCIEIGLFGDGMELIQISPKPFMLQPVRDELLVQAVQLYREYNEKVDAYTAYAYQFPKDDELIQDVNNLLPRWTHLRRENKFVQVLSDQEPLDSSWLTLLLKQNGKRGVLSYLYGLSLVYGTWIGEWWAMEIRFTYSGSVVSYEETFEWMKTRLMAQWYDVDWKIIDADLGQVSSIYIHDWTILEQFAVWQWVEDALPGRERAQRYKSKLLEYLKMEHTPWDMMKVIENGLLKLRKK